MDASLFGQYRSCRFNDSANAARLEMFQQRRFTAAERPRQQEIAIVDHNMAILWE